MRRVKTAVPMAEARARALTFLASLDRRDLMVASGVGAAIWPDATMTAQGLGGSASRILRKMQKDGLVEWTGTEHWWGYRITPAGRSATAAAMAIGATE